MRLMSVSDRRYSTFNGARRANWRGRSGRVYMLLQERIESFALLGAGLYLLARGSVPLWVGSADDVIQDAQSRSRFRLALEAADRAFAVDAEGDELSRMTVVWDLEGAEPVAGLSAA